MRAGEGQWPHLRRSLPNGAAFWKTRPSRIHPERFQGDSVTCDGVLHGHERRKVVWRKPKHRRRCGRDRGWRAGNKLSKFHVGKLPQMRIHRAGWPLPDQKFPVMLEDEGREPPRRRGFAPAEIGQGVNAIFPERHTEFPNRAKQTLRVARSADQRAEFHERLVQGGAPIVLIVSFSSSIWLRDPCSVMLEPPVVPPTSTIARS